MESRSKRQGMEQETSTRREVGGFMLRESAYRAGLRMAKHTHEPASFSFVLRGAYTERYEQRTRLCAPSMVVLHPRGETHAVSFHNRDARILNVQIGEAWFARIRECSTILDSPWHSEDGALACLALRLSAEFRRMDEFAPLAIQSLALELLTEASRRRARASVESKRAPRWLEQARELLHERFAETPSLAAVAATVAVHPVHLAREFRRWYGCTPGDYVRRLRVESACREIPRSQASLGEIAAAAGFYDQSHFCKTFKRFTGLTPAQFRAEFRRP